MPTEEGLSWDDIIPAPYNSYQPTWDEMIPCPYQDGYHNLTWADMIPAGPLG